MMMCRSGGGRRRPGGPPDLTTRGRPRGLRSGDGHHAEERTATWIGRRARATETCNDDEGELERRFGGMLRALRYGAPPHGGIAPGIDRIVMLIADQPNLREVTAFPLNQQAEELLLGAPSRVSERHLRELHIQLSMTAREALREEDERAAQVTEAEPKAATG